MLVLRKEIKVGLGVAAAALGIALVYGIMATLSANSKTPSQPSGETAVATTDAPSADPIGQSGLPPADDAGKVSSKSADPYLESARKDGSHTDPWTQALTTGKVAAEVQTVNNRGSLQPTPLGGFGTDNASSNTASSNGMSNGPIVTQAPVGPTHEGTTTTEEPSHGQPAGSGDTASVSASGTYKVESGETFSSIAAKLFGDKRMASAIQKANPSIEPRRLRAGATINVPAKEEVATIRGEIAKTPTRAVGTVNADKQYRVVSGDTLSRISMKLYGRKSQWEAIYAQNKALIGENPSKLKVGEVLALPKPPSVAAAH